MKQTPLIVPIAVAMVGIVALGKALISGEFHIRGGKWITTKSMPHNPILRSETPRDFWFAWGMSAFFLALLCFFIFRCGIGAD